MHMMWDVAYDVGRRGSKWLGRKVPQCRRLAKFTAFQQLCTPTTLVLGTVCTQDACKGCCCLPRVLNASGRYP